MLSVVLLSVVEQQIIETGTSLTASYFVVMLLSIVLICIICPVHRKLFFFVKTHTPKFTIFLELIPCESVSLRNACISASNSRILWRVFNQQLPAVWLHLITVTTWLVYDAKMTGFC